MAPQYKIEQFVSSTGVRIYRIPVTAFPELVAHVYLLVGAGPLTLVDTGSGYGRSNADLWSGIALVATQFGEAVSVESIGRVLITHGHIDHFGGLASLLDKTRPQVAIHTLDRGVLTAYRERVILATRSVRFFLEQAGVPEESLAGLLQHYGISKQHVRNVPVDLVLSDAMELDGLKIWHMPGHCPGQVCIGVGNIVLTADHVLAVTIPHQSPEGIMAYTGLGHYLESLRRMRRLGPFELALGGHEREMRDLSARIDEIEASMFRKIDRLLGTVEGATAPLSIFEMFQRLHPTAQGFQMLLALSQDGALVEYLFQRGELMVANVDELEEEVTLVPRFLRATH